MAGTSGGHVRRDVAAITELIIRLLAYTAPPPPWDIYAYDEELIVMDLQSVHPAKAY